MLWIIKFIFGTFIYNLFAIVHINAITLFADMLSIEPECLYTMGKEQKV